MSGTRPSMRGSSDHSLDGRRQRHWWAARAAGAVGLCAAVAGVLLYPGLVSGAGQAAAGSLAVAAKIESRVTTSTASPTAAPTLSEGELLITLPWGAEEGRVGLELPEEGLARGPEAVAVAPDGRIALLDAVNDRVVTLDATGGFRLNIPIDLAQPRFLAVTDELIYVLDCDADRLLLTVDWAGGERRISELPPLEDVVTDLLATDEGACVELAHDSVFLTSEPVELTAAGLGTIKGKRAGRASLTRMAARPLGHRSTRAAKVAFGADKKVRVKSFKTERGGLKGTVTDESTPALFEGMAIDHLVSVDGDTDESMIFGARLADTDGACRGASLVLTRWAQDRSVDESTPSRKYRYRAPKPSTPCDQVDETLLLADSPFAYLGRPYVVAPDGRIIQPIADENGYSLMVHRFADTQEVAS